MAEGFTREGVARGAAWLDEEKPGWAESFDLENFGMMSVEHCVLGQVFGRDTYHELLCARGVQWIVDHVFAGLTNEREWWVEEITARKQARVAVA